VRLETEGSKESAGRLELLGRRLFPEQLTLLPPSNHLSLHAEKSISVCTRGPPHLICRIYLLPLAREEITQEKKILTK
jgi:hypothetical protein